MIRSSLRLLNLPWLLALCATLLVTACGSAPEGGTKSAATGGVVAPVQSPNDDRAYRLVTLDNDLQVLLISDPDTKKAAAALDVYVGSGDNPPGRGGLAHFLEHMLFLGTDKYPEPGEYGAFIAEHGGGHNAYTSFEHTNYFFDIEAPHLEQGLDRFAQFFISPRFDAQYVDREKNAVQAEYQMGLKSDSRRGLDVLQEVMNPAHPFSQFAVGSLDSLADRPGSPIRDELLDFYAKHYSANLMRLAVLGAQPLDELEAMVRPMFAPVPNRHKSHATIDAPIFDPDQLPVEVRITPQATQRTLDLLFPMPDYRPLYHAKPVAYLSNLLGHEGEGSLLSQLKAEGLAEGLVASSGLGWQGGSLFNVRMSLTEQGLGNYDRVIQLLFAYVDMLRDEGPQRWLYQEQSQQAALAFRFAEKGEPMGYVSNLAQGMHYYDPIDTLRGPFIMDDYRAAQLREVIDRVRPDNAVVQVVAEGVTTDRRSEHYEVPYALAPVDDSRVAQWLSAPGDVALAMPAPNEFIAENVELLPVSADNPALPARLLSSDRVAVWFQQDAEFRIPRGATYINFRSPQVGQSVDQSAAAMVYVALLKDSVNEFAYPAALAGLDFDLYKHGQGVSLRVSGYTDKQLKLLERILAAIEEGSFASQRFTNIRDDIVRSLENIKAARPSSQVMRRFREAMLHGEWSDQALIEQLQGLDLAGVETYAEAFWRDASAEVLVYGNYHPERAKAVAKLLESHLPDGLAPARPPLRVTKLSAGDDLLLRANVPHDDAVEAWYQQGEADDWHNRAAIALTAQIVKTSFFEQLRTEQQLGYVVSAFAYPLLEVPGMMWLVQSPGHSADGLWQSMVDFKEAVPASVDAELFARHQAALLGDILEPDKNLWERAEYYWQSIARKEYAFDGRQQLAAAVRAFDLDGWRTYFQRVFLDQPHSLQVVAPGQWDSKLPPAGRKFTDATVLKAALPSYAID